MPTQYDHVWSVIKIDSTLSLGANCNLDVDGTVIDLAELAAINSIAAADLAKIDGITNGTSAAGKALVLDANGFIDTFGVGAITASDASLGITGLVSA